MAHQNLRTVDALESNWVTSRNLGLNDIFPKFKHYNVKTVASAMKSLLELVTLHPIVLKVYLGKILNEVIPLILFGEEEVHKSVINFLSYSLPKISSVSFKDDQLFTHETGLHYTICFSYYGLPHKWNDTSYYPCQTLYP